MITFPQAVWQSHPDPKLCLGAKPGRPTRRFSCAHVKSMSSQSSASVVGVSRRVKKPHEAPKAKAFWKMKAAKDAEEEHYDPEREDNILGKSQTRLALCEEHLKDPIVALDRALEVRGEFVQGVFFGSRFCGGTVLQFPLLASFKVCGSSRYGRAFGPNGIRWIVGVCAQPKRSGMCQGSTGRLATSFAS